MLLAAEDEDALIMYMIIGDAPVKHLRKTFRFDLNSLNKAQCWRMFRFKKLDLVRMKRNLQIPDRVRLPPPQQRDFTGLESLCIFLRRFAYPNRLCDLYKMFGRNKQRTE